MPERIEIKRVPGEKLGWNCALCPSGEVEEEKVGQLFATLTFIPPDQTDEIYREEIILCLDHELFLMEVLFNNWKKRLARKGNTLAPAKYIKKEREVVDADRNASIYESA